MIKMRKKIKKIKIMIAGEIRMRLMSKKWKKNKISKFKTRIILKKFVMKKI